MINNLIIKITFLFTNNKFIENYVINNFKYFKYAGKSKNIVLVEFHGWSFNNIVNSYLANFLAKKYSAKIHSYPGYVLNKYTLDLYSKIKFIISNFLPIKTFLIYRSFGVKKFFYPKLSKSKKIEALKIFENKIKSIKNIENLVTLKINKVLIGDLIYDSFLKFYNEPTIDLKSKKFQNFLYESIKNFVYWEDYLKKNNIKAIVITHSVYNGAIPMRIAIEKFKKITVWSGEAYGVYNYSKNFSYGWLNFKNIDTEFKKQSPNQKKLAMKIAEKKIFNRLNGIKNDGDMHAAKISPYSKIFQKRIIKKNKKIKVLVAAHCFLDSPHILGNFLFPDFMHWLNFLAEVSKKTNYDWYIKSHPNFKRETFSILKDFVKRNKKFKLLPVNYSHKQIINEKISCALTVYGTIGWEYAYLGIPVINASMNGPHSHCDFNINPKNIKEYKKIIFNLDKIKININKKEILKFYFIAYVNNFVDWIVQNKKNISIIIKDFKRDMTPSTYDIWLKDFVPNKHHKIMKNLNNFYISKRYRITKKNCNINIF